MPKTPDLSKVYITKSTRLLLPAINLTINKTNYTLLKYYGFVNCYLDWVECPDVHKDCLFLVFNPSDEAMQVFPQFYEVYKTYPNFVQDYVLDTNLVILVFSILKKWKKAVEAFKRSKYSEMSLEYADIFKRIDFNSDSVQFHAGYHIITKSPTFRKALEQLLSNPKSPVTIDQSAELLSPLEIQDEIFSYGCTKPTEVFSGQLECEVSTAE